MVLGFPVTFIVDIFSGSKGTEDDTITFGNLELDSFSNEEFCDLSRFYTTLSYAFSFISLSIFLSFIERSCSIFSILRFIISIVEVKALMWTSLLSTIFSYSS